MVIWIQFKYWQIIFKKFNCKILIKLNILVFNENYKILLSDFNLKILNFIFDVLMSYVKPIAADQ